MADFFKNLKANELISAIICMALGIVLIIWPGTSVKVACMILGGALLLYGVLQIILYLFAKERTAGHAPVWNRAGSDRCMDPAETGKYHESGSCDRWHYYRDPRNQ